MEMVVLALRSIKILTYAPACKYNERNTTRTTDFEVVICHMICLPHTSVNCFYNK